MIEMVEQPLSRKSEIQVIRKLVSQLHQMPEDDETAEVVLDWCETLGFDEIGKTLRDGKRPGFDKAVYRHRVVSALRVLFGDDPASRTGAGGGRYSIVLGLPRIFIGPMEVVTISITTECLMRIRRFVLPSRIHDRVMINDLVVGRFKLLGNDNPVPADIFGETSFDLFDHAAYVGTEIRLIVTNISNVEIDVHGCILGDEAIEGQVEPDVQIKNLEREVVAEKNRVELLETRVQALEAALIRSMGAR
jgi:hypothetical protein